MWVGIWPGLFYHVGPKSRLADGPQRFDPALQRGLLPSTFGWALFTERFGDQEMPTLHPATNSDPFRYGAMMETTSTPSTAPPSLQEFKARRKPHRDINKEHREGLKPLDRVALWITTRVGTMGFFLIIFTWTTFWLGWNFLAPKALRFDPPMGFVFWLFISNVIQILLMPLIMVGQNIQGAHAESRAEHDLEINVQAEDEIEVVLQHLEYQNSMLLQLMQKLDAKVDGALEDAANAGA